MSVGHAPDQPQWTPDMRKDDADITQADRAEAHRRIRGNAGSEDSPEDSSGDDIVLPSTMPPSF